MTLPMPSVNVPSTSPDYQPMATQWLAAYQRPGADRASMRGLIHKGVNAWQTEIYHERDGSYGARFIDGSCLRYDAPTKAWTTRPAMARPPEPATPKPGTSWTIRLGGLCSDGLPETGDYSARVRWIADHELEITLTDRVRPPPEIARPEVDEVVPGRWYTFPDGTRRRLGEGGHWVTAAVLFPLT